MATPMSTTTPLPKNGAGADEPKVGKKEVATAAFEKMNKRQQLALFAAAGLKAGPNVSLAYAIDKFRRDKMREVILYAFFLLLFTVSALSQRDVTDAHYYTATVKDAILNENFPDVTWYKTFHDISVSSDFWDYMCSVIPKFLYNEVWYNGDPYLPEEKNYVLHVNRLVQAPRLRQLRVNKENCPVPPRLQGVMGVCYPSFTQASENKTDIGGWPPGKILTYKTAEQLRTSAYRNGLLPYGGGGFALDIPLYYTKAQALDFFTHLKETKWTDLHTRAVFFDFALYNPVNGLYLSVRLLFEFLPYGQVRPSSQFRAMRIGLSSMNDYASLLLDAVVYFLVVLYILGDIRKLLAMGRSYWTHFWHWFNWVNYLIFVVTFALKLSFYLPSLEYVNGAGDLDIQQATLDFEALGWTYYQMINFQAFNNIFVWLKAFSFLKYINADVANLSYTVTRAAKDCGLFFLIFAMVIFSYAQAFHIAFGTDIEEYKTVTDAIFGLFKTLLGDFDFEAMKARNAYLGPLLFVTFEIVCYFVFLNMFLAILNKTYSDVVDNGVDDPMAVEFRATVAQYWQQFKTALQFWKRGDDLAAYRDEDEDDEKDDDEVEQKKSALDGEALGMMLKTITELSTTLRGLNEKVDGVAKVQALAGANTRLQTLNRSTIVVDREEAPQRQQEDSSAQNSTMMTMTAEELGPPIPARAPRAPAGLAGYSSAAATNAGGKSSSVGPAGLRTMNATDAKTIPTKTASGKPILPPEWKAYEDEKGKTYYFNEKTKKTSWDPPTIAAPIVHGTEHGDGDNTPRM